MAEEKKRRILIAEDNGLLRDTLTDIFGMEFPEYVLEAFRDGNSLDERLKKDVGDVRLVFTDNQMPGVYGSEIIRRHARRLPEIPFILHYGGDKSIGESAVKDGAYAYIIKNIDSIEATVDAVKTALEAKVKQ